VAFQLKNFVSIVASMVNRMKATQTNLTDFNIGAAGRTLVEAPAIEIDQLYQQMFNGLTQAIPVSVFQSFNFPPLSAIGSSGTMTVTVAASTNPIVISAGTVFSATATAITWSSTASVTIPPSTTTVSVPVTATTTGSSTNLVADVAFTMTPAPVGFSSATNLSPFVNGLDTETPAAQQIRFAAFVNALPRGTVAALYYAMTLANVQDANGNIIEQVRLSSVVEPWLTDGTQPVSVVNCYIHNGIGSTSVALQTSVNNMILGYYNSSGVAVPGYKAAGVKVNTVIATEVAVAVTGVITAAAGYSLTDQVINGVTVPGLETLAAAAITSYLMALAIGQSAIKAEIVALVMNIPGVYNYVGSLPAADVTATVSQKLMPGTITLT
jgi:hypothetical protein